MLSFKGTLVILFAAQHKLVLFDLRTREKSDISINFSWTSDGFVDKIDMDPKGNMLLHFAGKLTLCQLGLDRLENAVELRGD